MKKFAVTFFIIALLLTLNITVKASGVDLPEEIQLERPIEIPLFLPIDLSFSSSATLFSWLSFLGIVATIGLVVFWIIMIIRASIKALQSEGEPDGIKEASDRFKAILTGVILTFLVPIVLSVVGIFMGIGTIFSWPKMFSSCEGGVSIDGDTNYEYYYQVYLEQGELSADTICGYSTPLPRAP